MQNNTVQTVLQIQFMHRCQVNFLSFVCFLFWIATTTELMPNDCFFEIEQCCLKQPLFPLIHSLGSESTIDKSTPYKYLLPRCHCVCIDFGRCSIRHRDRISEAQTPCSVYMNIIPPITAWQKFCLNLLCTGFPMKCVKLKLYSPLFMCTEWITCSHTSLWGCNTHSEVLQPWVNLGRCLLYQLEPWEFFITRSSLYKRFIHVDPTGNKSQLFLLMKSYCSHEGEGTHWLFTLYSIQETKW